MSLSERESPVQFPSEIICLIVSLIPGPFPVPLAGVSEWNPKQWTAGKILYDYSRSNTLIALTQVSRIFRSAVLPIASEHFEVVRELEEDEDDIAYVQEISSRLVSQINLYTIGNPVMATYVQ